MYKLENSIKIEYLKENSVVLDIETTGVSRIHSKVVVVGLLDHLGNFSQFAIENEDEEAQLLEEIFPYLNNKNIITFNGQNFDIPFLKERYKFFGMKSFEESSQFDIYRFLISNRLITDFEKFALQEIEKIKDLERNENFEVQDDILFYKKIIDMDISKIMIHNKYDVINTESILSIVNEINQRKTFQLIYKENSHSSIIENINLDKNILEISSSLKNIDIPYRFEDGKYYLDWSNDRLTVRLNVMEGYLDDNNLGYAHLLEKDVIISDESNFNLHKNVLPIFCKRYYLENIKNLISFIFERYIK